MENTGLLTGNADLLAAFNNGAANRESLEGANVDFRGTASCAAAATPDITRRTLAEATMRLFAKISSAILSMREIAPPSLLIKSTAPKANARMVASVPLCVKLLTISVGVGHLSIMTAKALSPSITGIFTSNVNKSGVNSCVFAIASLPFAAVPTTVKSSCLLKRSDKTRRMNTESSAISTRIILEAPSSFYRNNEL